MWEPWMRTRRANEELSSAIPTNGPGERTAGKVQVGNLDHPLRKLTVRRGRRHVTWVRRARCYKISSSRFDSDPVSKSWCGVTRCDTDPVGHRKWKMGRPTRRSRSRPESKPGCQLKQIKEGTSPLGPEIGRDNPVSRNSSSRPAAPDAVGWNPLP